MSSVDEIPVELAFAAAYDVSLMRELPGHGGVEHVFARDERTADGGPLIEVIASSDAWTGMVVNAPESISAAHSGVYSTPRPDVICVVARGDAYFINVDDPERWWTLEDSPVVAVRGAVTEGLLLLATPWRVVAVGEAGVVWRTSRIAIDGISLGEVSGGVVVGVADPNDDEAQDFTIELRTGHHRGGFPFPG